MKNTTGATVDYTQYVVALYNDEGRVVGYRWGMLDPISLLPSGEAPFEASFFDPPRFSHYEVFILD